MFLESAPQNGEKDKLWKRILSVVLYLLFWIVLSAAALWLMFEIRGLLVELMIDAQLSPWAVRGYDRWAIFILGLIWFISILWIEHYLRTAIEKKRLWRNTGRVAIVQIMLGAVIFGARLVINL